jgi:hypothetical protein
VVEDFESYRWILFQNAAGRRLISTSGSLQKNELMLLTLATSSK